MIENKPFVCYFQSKQAKLSYCFVRALTATSKHGERAIGDRRTKKIKQLFLNARAMEKQLLYLL